jgi:hypothetical protein
VLGKHEAEEMKEAAKKKAMKVLRRRWEAWKATIVIVGEFLADDSVFLDSVASSFYTSNRMASIVISPLPMLLPPRRDFPPLSP